MNQQIINLVCSYPICAAHQLMRPDWTVEKNRQVYGKCAHIHGHQYTLELNLCGSINAETGMLINAFAVDDIVKPFITTYFDHKFLNQDVPFFHDRQPTAEWIAVWVFHELKGKFKTPVTLKKVKVYETPELAVEYPAA